MDTPLYNYYFIFCIAKFMILFMIINQLTNMFATYGATIDFTCLEMRDSEQPSSCLCAPEELVIFFPPPFVFSPLFIIYYWLILCRSTKLWKLHRALILVCVKLVSFFYMRLFIYFWQLTREKMHFLATIRLHTNKFSIHFVF